MHTKNNLFKSSQERNKHMDKEELQLEDNNSLTIQFPPEATQKIDAIAAYYNCSSGEIIGRALALMEIAYIYTTTDNSLCIVNKDNLIIEKISI